MGTPQIITLVLMFITLLVKMIKNGQPREPWSAAEGTIDFTLLLGLLYWGGFFNG